MCKWTNGLPTRYVVGIMAFLSSTFAYIVRAGFSLNLLAMVNVYDENGTMIEQPDYGPRYDWTVYQQGLLLGAFFYSYTLAVMPVGLMLDRFGIGRQYVLFAFCASALIIVLSPLAASAGPFGWLFGMRLVLGAVQCGTFINIHRLISRWSPPSELGMFMLTLAGSNVGTMLTWVVASAIISAWGWQWSFYVDAMVIGVFVALWWYNVYDRPSLHPRITTEEREFIQLSKPQAVTNKDWPPLLKIATSMPFWAALLLNFSNDWGWYFLMSGAPKFMNQVLGYQLSSTGVLAAVPYLVNLLGNSLFAFVGDRMRHRNCMSLINIRRLFLVISNVLPSLCLFGVPFVPADRPNWCVVLMTVAFFFNGANVQSTLANVHDLGSSCAASLMAIINCVAASNGFISPLVVAYFTRDHNTVAEWQYVFYTAASVYLLAVAFFMCFGSVKDQKWMESRSTDKMLNEEA